MGRSVGRSRTCLCPRSSTRFQRGLLGCKAGWLRLGSSFDVCSERDRFKSLIWLAGVAGLEPATPGFGVRLIPCLPVLFCIEMPLLIGSFSRLTPLWCQTIPRRATELGSKMVAGCSHSVRSEAPCHQNLPTDLRQTPTDLYRTPTEMTDKQPEQQAYLKQCASAIYRRRGHTI